MEPETKAGGDQPAKATMDQRARETAGELKVKEVEADVFLAHHPCSSLLQLLLRACAGCLGLHGYCSDDDGDDDYLKLKPAAANEDAAAPAVAETPKEGAGGGEAASEVDARVRKPPKPSPEEGSGDDGGKHH